MTGPEHYAAAERLLASCQLPWTDVNDVEAYPAVALGHEDDVDSCRNALMAAQVHATLALAAAQVTIGRTSLGATDANKWAGVLR